MMSLGVLYVLVYDGWMERLGIFGEEAFSLPEDDLAHVTWSFTLSAVSLPSRIPQASQNRISGGLSFPHFGQKQCFGSAASFSASRVGFGVFFTLNTG